MQISALTTSTTVDSLHIAFITDIPGKASVLMLDGNSQPSDVYPMNDDISGKGHTVDIIGLIPNTDYDYSITLVAEDGVEWPVSNLPTVHTQPVDILAPPKIRIDLEGPNSVSAGYKLYLKFRSVVLGGEGNQHLTITDVASLPPNSRFRLYTGYGINGEPCLVNSSGQDWIWGGSNYQCGAYLETGALTPSGSYDFVVRATAANGATAERRYGVTVANPDFADPPTIQETVPGEEAWHSTMIVLADKWADWALANKCSFGVESEPWYYDGGRVFLQVAAETQKQKYADAGIKILLEYADYIIAADGKIPGWRKFPHGLELAIREGHDLTGKFEQALRLLYDSCNDWHLNGASLVRGDCADVHFIRELAYGLNCLRIGDAILDVPGSSWIDEGIEAALGMIDQMVHKQVMDQPFMGGLLAEALIDLELDVPDPESRILGALKALADHYIEKAILPDGSGAMAYSLLPKPRTYITELNNMVVPLFTWLAKELESDIYRDVADLLFTASMRGDLAYSGKIFCQNYRWSFAHVEWRAEV